MRHLHSALPQFCLFTLPIIDLLTQTYANKFFFSPVVSYILTAFLGNFRHPLLFLVSGSMTQMHTEDLAKIGLTFNGRAPSVMLCPFFFSSSSFASKCCGRQCVRVPDGFVLARVLQNRGEKELEGKEKGQLESM